MSERSNLELGIWNLEFARMGYLVDSSSGHLLWFESVARKPAPVAGPRCEDDEGRWPASSVSWPGPLGLLARSAIEIGDLHTASRHGLEPHDLRAYWSQLNSPISREPCGAITSVLCVSSVAGDENLCRGNQRSRRRRAALIEAFAEELEQALRIVSILPGAGSPYTSSAIANVRRLYL